MRGLILYLIDEMPFFWAIITFGLLNLAMYLGGTFLGEWLSRRSPSARIQPGTASPFGRQEITLGLSSTVINVGITVIGLWLYRLGVISLNKDASWPRLLFDVFLFLLAMDALMYFSHRTAHIRWLYWLHVLHHKYDKPTAGSLFVLHPFETAGFGSLWIVLLFFYPFSVWAVVAYVGLNLYYGLVGHLGVELYPSWWVKYPGINLFTTCTFHDQHHQHPNYNLGFYTTLWDRLFGTLYPSYESDFIQNSRKARGV